MGAMNLLQECSVLSHLDPALLALSLEVQWASEQLLQCALDILTITTPAMGIFLIHKHLQRYMDKFYYPHYRPFSTPASPFVPRSTTLNQTAKHNKDDVTITAFTIYDQRVIDSPGFVGFRAVVI